VLTLDANGLRFWMLADEPHWHRWGDPAPVEYDTERRRLRLAGRRDVPSWPADLEEALRRLDQVPATRDAFGTLAEWDPAEGCVMARGPALPGLAVVFSPPTGERPTDLAMGHDGILYLAIAGRVVMQDRRDRWPPVSLDLAGFQAERLAADPAGGVWVLDRKQGVLGRVLGRPLPERLLNPPGLGGTMGVRPCQENPDPPRLFLVARAEGGETPVALACGPTGRVVLLCWLDGQDVHLRELVGYQLGPPIVLEGIRHAYSLGWLSEDRIAVLVPKAREAAVFKLKDGTTARTLAPVGDFYPLRDHDGGPFLHGLDFPPHYPSAGRSRPLHRLSLPAFASSGEASNLVPIDSGSERTQWHRLYLEAVIPPQCGIVVRLAAGDALSTVSSCPWPTMTCC